VNPPTTATKPKRKRKKGGPAEPKQRADATRNREAVLVAAREGFAEIGLDCGMDEVARRAGLGVGTVYRHFPNKELLIKALIEDHFISLAERGAQALEEDDPWEAFCDFMRWTAQLGARDRGLAEVLGHRPEQGQAAAVGTGLVETTATLIANAQASGKMRKDAIVEDVPTMVCGLGGATGAPAESFPGQNWERLLEIILDGLRATPGQPPLPAPKRTFEAGR
jgi:AcrR family transcriptional regulator